MSEMDGGVQKINKQLSSTQQIKSTYHTKKEIYENCMEFVSKNKTTVHIYSGDGYKIQLNRVSVTI